MYKNHFTATLAVMPTLRAMIERLVPHFSPPKWNFLAAWGIVKIQGCAFRLASIQALLTPTQTRVSVLLFSRSPDG
jgi:hypothetical protein